MSPGKLLPLTIIPASWELYFLLGVTLHLPYTSGLKQRGVMCWRWREGYDSAEDTSSAHAGGQQERC